MKERLINWLIKTLKADTNKISDGYHTFQELYDHRIALWIALCRRHETSAWRTQVHSDGTSWDGWFVLGLKRDAGKQITYHLPMKYWDQCDFADTISKAHKFDGHSPADVVKRLTDLK